MATLRTILAGAAMLLSASPGPASAQACRSGLEQNRQQMAANAIQCGESAALMGAIQRGSGGQIPADELAEMCTSGRDGSGQLAAFNACSRVYVCATLAYTYALDNIGRFGGDCTAAASAGLKVYPVR